MLVILGLALGWFFMSVKIIHENERGVLVRSGVIIRMLEPGVNFCAWPISKVIIYKMTPMLFKIKVPTAITKNGKVKGYKEDGREIEKVEVDIFLTLTTYFPNVQSKLLETARRAPGNSAKSLGPVIVPYITDVVRAIFAEMPWVLSYQNRQKVLDYITSKIIPLHPYSLLKFDPVGPHNVFYFEDAKSANGDDAATMERYNPLVQFKLDLSLTSLSITDINFCDNKLTASLTLAESARLKSEADAIASDRETKRIKEQGLAAAEVDKKKKLDEVEAVRKAGIDRVDATRLEGFDKVEISKAQGEVDTEIIRKKGVAQAKARDEMIKVIKDNPDLEALRTLMEMAQGTSNTILYGLPSGMGDKISQILGGNKPEEILGFLKDPEILKVLKETFEKITK